MSKQKPPNLTDEEKALFRQSVGQSKPIQNPYKAHEPDRKRKPNVKNVTADENDLAGFSLGFAPAPLGAEETVSFGLERLDRKFARLIRRGDLAFDLQADFHGCTIEEASQQLHQLLQEASSLGYRYLHIIHGKGRNIEPSTNTLKTWITHWCREYPKTLALHSAHRKHGGPGALYLILRKEK